MAMKLFLECRVEVIFVKATVILKVLNLKSVLNIFEADLFISSYKL